MVSKAKGVNYLRIAFLFLVFIEVSASGKIFNKENKDRETIFLNITSRPRGNFKKMESTVGFISPVLRRFQGKGKMSLIYDFRADHNDSVEFNITLIFHEYYFNFKIFFCNSRENIPTGNRFRARDALNMPFNAMDRVIGEYNSSCRVIDPVQHPVYSFTGPGFMEVYKNSESYIPKRFGLLSQDVFNHTLFNFTYELILNERNELLADRQVPYDFLAPPSVASLTEGHACSLNGIPVLRLVNRHYTFECKCLQGTYGDRCEWGSMCPEEQARQLCFNHGKCRATIGIEEDKTCVCDAGFDGVDCRFPILKKGEPMFRFNYNGTSGTLPSKKLLALKIKSLLPCNHSLQNARIEDDIQVDNNSQMVRLLNNESLIYREVLSLAGECRLQTQCNGTTRAGANSQNLEWNTVALRSPTLIKSFKNHSTHICCTICSAANSEIIFFKDEIPINLTPIRPYIKDNWKEGQLEIESYNNEYPEVCLKIPYFPENDIGKYRCQVADGNYKESKYYTVETNQVRLLEVEPKSIDVLKESDVRINCLWEDGNLNSTGAKFQIKPKWNVSPRENFGNFSYYPYGTAGSFLMVHNITGELSVTCTIDNYSTFGSESKESQIAILDPEGFFCKSEIAHKINWPNVQVYKSFIARCPRGYKGHCVRECSSVKNSLGHAVWNLPDCSKCERKKIFSMLANATSYQRGILNFLPNPKNFFAEIRNEFINGNSSEILPGEIGMIVNRSISFLEVPELVPDIKVFYSWIDIMISSKDAIHEKDLSALQTLLKAFPRLLVSESCFLSISDHENVVFYEQMPRVENEIFNESISLNRSITGEINRGRNRNPSEELRNSFTKMYVQFKEKLNSSKRSITILKHPELILPFQKRILSKEADVHRNYLDDDEFGEVSSPLVQINVNSDEKKSSPKQEVTDDVSEIAVKLIFSPCQLQSVSSYVTHRCGQFDPESRSWTLAKCSFSSTNNFCSCSCSDIGGWIGLVTINKQKVSKELVSMSNAAATWGCGISLVFLLFTAISFLIQCAQSSMRVFARFLETFSLMVVNAVFLYCSLYETNEVAHMTVLMIISISVVLVIGLSVSHQVDIHQKCTIGVANPSKSLNPPSSIMLLVSTFVAVFLGGILWIIGKVQKIKLSNAWLPETDDSTLSFAVLIFIFFLLILQLALALYNCYKVNYVFHNPNWNTESLSSELKKRCIIGFLETIYIFSSWYQNAYVGMYIFPLIAVTLSVTFFIFSIFSCSSHSGYSASRSSTSKDINAYSESKIQKFVNRFNWKWFRVPYSGVAETENSNIHNDESMEMEKSTTRGDGDSSFDASTINGYEQESPLDRPNCITTQVDIEFDCRIVPCNANMGCVCSPLPSVGEHSIPQDSVDNFYTPIVAMSYPMNRNVKPDLEAKNKTPTEGYLNMEGTTTNNQSILVRNSCIKTPKNRYVNMLPKRNENDALTQRNSNGSFTVPWNENRKMFAHMNGNGNAKSIIPSNELSPVKCPSVESTSKSQNASPHVPRIAEYSRTKSVDALTSQMSPDERKKRFPSQFISLRQLISKNKSGSMHFDSGNCVYSENDLEKNGLIMAEDKSECISPADSQQQEFISNCQDSIEHHKRIMSP